MQNHTRSKNADTYSTKMPIPFFHFENISSTYFLVFSKIFKRNSQYSYKKRHIINKMILLMMMMWTRMMEIKHKINNIVGNMAFTLPTITKILSPSTLDD